MTLVIIQRIHVHHGRQRGSATEQNAVKHHTGIDTVVVTKISDLRQSHPGGRAKRLTVNTGNQSLHNLINTGPVYRFPVQQLRHDKKCPATFNFPTRTPLTTAHPCQKYRWRGQKETVHILVSPCAGKGFHLPQGCPKQLTNARQQCGFGFFQHQINPFCFREKTGVSDCTCTRFSPSGEAAVLLSTPGSVLPSRTCSSQRTVSL